MVFKFAYFVELAKAISLQGFNAVDFLGQVLQRDYKNTMMMSFHSLGFEISIFCETDYKLSACEVSNPLVIRIEFYRGWYKTPKKLL